MTELCFSTCFGIAAILNFLEPFYHVSFTSYEKKCRNINFKAGHVPPFCLRLKVFVVSFQILHQSVLTFFANFVHFKWSNQKFAWVYCSITYLYFCFLLENIDWYPVYFFLFFTMGVFQLINQFLCSRKIGKQTSKNWLLITKQKRKNCTTKIISDH